MLEVVIPGQRYGECVMDTANVKRGAHCYISGINADGYQKLNVPSSTAMCYYRTYPVNKYYFAEDGSDFGATVDAITKGDLCIYYDGGEYITNQWRPSTFGLSTTYWKAVENTSATSWGRNPYVPGSSTAHASVGLNKVFVCTGVGLGNKGVLVGSTSFAVTLVSSACYVGFVTGIYYKDSASAYLRYRVSPGYYGGASTAKSRGAWANVLV